MYYFSYQRDDYILTQPKPLFFFLFLLKFTLKNFIIIIRHELVFERPDPTSSNCLFKGLPNRLLPFGL